MLDRLQRITLLLSGLVLVVFVIFVINQTAQVVSLARGVHPAFGTAVLVGLLALYAALLATPLVMWFRLPPPIEPPDVTDGPEFDEHLDLMRKRLRGVPADADRAAIESAIAELDAQATEAIRQSAAQVFLSTAISQSGRLDTFVVLSANVRLVWRVANIYYQRPTVRDMWHLYANVAATAFLAGELDDVDVSEQVQPIITSVLGSVGTAIPGLQVATSLVVNSILGGSTNAFLTLRVGAVAQQYCAPLLVADRRRIRRSATAKAAGLLGGIVSAGAKRVVSAVVKASRDRLLGRSRIEDPAGDLDEEEVAPRRRWGRRTKPDATLDGT